MPNNLKFGKRVIISLVIISFSVTINFILNISSYEDVYKKTLISKFTQINSDINSLITTGINLGKPLYKFSNIEKHFKSVIRENEDIKNVFVTSVNGKVLYSYEEEYNEKYIVNELLPKERLENTKTKLLNERYFVYSSIIDSEENLQGYIYIEFLDDVIEKETARMISKKFNVFITAIISSSLFFIILYIVVRSFYLKKMEIKQSQMLVIVALLVSQISYTYVSLSNFENQYIGLLNNNLENVSNRISEELDYFTNLGLELRELKNFEHYLERKVREVTECTSVIVTDENENILYYANKSGETKSILDNQISDNILNDISLKYLKMNEFSSNTQNGKIYLQINKKMINSKRLDLFLDTATMLIISVIIGYQMLLLSNIKIKEFVADKVKVVINKNYVIQILAFLFFFAEMLPLSFIPIYIRKIYEDDPINIFNLSTEVILGIPIAVYMFGTALAVLGGGFLTDKISEKRILKFSAFFLASGALGASFSTNILQLTMFRLISGFGYGGINIAGTSVILSIFKKQKVATGFGFWASGYGAASLCAVPIGGVIVYRFGYIAALVVSALISAGLFIYIAIYFKYFSLDSEAVETYNENFDFKKMLNIFSDRKVFANYFFRLLPFHLVYIGIFQFMMPLYMNEEGISQANIGRLLTIFGLVYLAMPIISKLVDKIQNDKLFIIIGGFIIGGCLLLIKIPISITVFVLIILGISIGSMVGDAAEESFITSTEKAKEIGETKFMSIYTSYERLIMVAAPLISSVAVASLGYVDSIFIIGLYVLVSSVIYTILVSGR